MAFTSNSLGGLLGRIKDTASDVLIDFVGSQRFLIAQLDITNACNLRCDHCYHPHHANKHALSLEDWRSVLDQYSALISKLRLKPSFVICGGEPTLSANYLPILGELDRRWPGVEAAVTTNGTALTADLLRRSERFNLSYQISLDGPDPARHDALRGRGAYSAAISGLKTLQDSGKNANLLATLSHRSAGWIANYFATARATAAAAMNFVRFISQGSGRRFQDEGRDRTLGPHELRNAYTAIVAESRSSGVRTNTDHPLYCLVDEKLGTSGLLGHQGIVIDYRGNLKVSSRTEPVLGNVLEVGLEELFLRHRTMRDLRSGKIEFCGTCVYYTRCGGDRNVAYAETGDFLAKDPACWLPPGTQGGR